MPWKTILAVITFAGLMLLPQVVAPLQNLKTFDPHTIPVVWEMPVPKPPPEPVATLRHPISIQQDAAQASPVSEEPASTPWSIPHTRWIISTHRC